MIGDNLMIYNPTLDMFYAGRVSYYRVMANQPPVIRWERDPYFAKCSNALTLYKKICKELGGGVRIVSETEARRIVMMRKYREAHNERCGAEESEPTVLSFAWALPTLRGNEPGAARQGVVRGVPEEA